jgi:hypothetical protein
MRAGDHELLAKLPEERYPEMAALEGKPVLACWDPTSVRRLRD